MPSVAASRRYARAAFEVALAHAAVDRWERDLQRVSTLLRDARVQAFLNNPKVSRATKRQAIQDALAGQLDPLVLRFVLLLIDKDRIRALPAILDQFQQLVLEHKGIVRARVTTAVPLDPSEQQLVARRLEELTGRQVELETTVDPAIMGGLIVRIGDKVIDASTRSRLLALRAALQGAAP
jgi:F-type H+-transporting ATPase subunit delta